MSIWSSRWNLLEADKGDGRLSFVQWIVKHRRNHFVALTALWLFGMYFCFVSPGWENTNSGERTLGVTLACPILFFLELRVRYRAFKLHNPVGKAKEPTT